MATCAYCKDEGVDDVDRDLAHIREHAARTPRTAGGSSANRGTRQPNKIRTAHCLNPTCKVTKTGLPKELAGFRCPDHGGPALETQFNTGERVQYNGKKFEILELVDNVNLRLRTGAKDGKIVLFSEVAKIS